MIWRAHGAVGWWAQDTKRLPLSLSTVSWLNRRKLIVSTLRLSLSHYTDRLALKWVAVNPWPPYQCQGLGSRPPSPWRRRTSSTLHHQRVQKPTSSPRVRDAVTNPSSFTAALNKHLLRGTQAQNLCIWPHFPQQMWLNINSQTIKQL